MIVKEIARDSQNELIINKSKFIALSFAVHGVEEVGTILSKIKKEYNTSTHVCFAYKLLGGEEKCSDDGEPQGTAGRPILDVIKKSSLVNLLVAVVRYFGGVKLGAGGLVRAYSNSASTVLSNSGAKISTECKKLQFNLPLSASKFVNALENIDGIKKFHATYHETIVIDLYALNEDLSHIQSQAQNILGTDVEFLVDNKTYFV